MILINNERLKLMEEKIKALEREIQYLKKESKIYVPSFKAYYKDPMYEEISVKWCLERILEKLNLEIKVTEKQINITEKVMENHKKGEFHD